MKKAALIIAACIAAANIVTSVEVSAEIQVVTKAQNKSNTENGQLSSEDMILIDLNEYTAGKYRIAAEIPAKEKFKGIKAPEGNEMAVVYLGVFNTHKNVYPAGNASTSFFLRDTKSNTKYNADEVLSGELVSYDESYVKLGGNIPGESFSQVPLVFVIPKDTKPSDLEFVLEYKDSADKVKEYKFALDKEVK